MDLSFDDSFGWFSPETKYVVIGMGRSGTTVIVRALMNATRRAYEGEVLKDFHGKTVDSLQSYLHYFWHADTIHGRELIHKITLRSLTEAHFYPCLKDWMDQHGYRPLFVHRDPLDCFKSELVLRHTGVHLVRPYEDATKVPWPSQIVLAPHRAKFVARSYWHLHYFRSLYAPGQYDDIHYNQIDGLFRHLKTEPNHVKLSPYYPEWDVDVATEMLDAALLEFQKDMQDQGLI